MLSTSIQIFILQTKIHKQIIFDEGRNRNTNPWPIYGAGIEPTPPYLLNLGPFAHNFVKNGQIADFFNSEKKFVYSLTTYFKISKIGLQTKKWHLREVGAFSSVKSELFY